MVKTTHHKLMKINFIPEICPDCKDIMLYFVHPETKNAFHWCKRCKKESILLICPKCEKDLVEASNIRGLKKQYCYNCDKLYNLQQLRLLWRTKNKLPFSKKHKYLKIIKYVELGIAYHEIGKMFGMSRQAAHQIYTTYKGYEDII